MQIISPAFDNNQEIPEKYACEGEDINPPFQLEDIPMDAASLTLMVVDPDAPGKTFVHWILFNIDPGIKNINEDSLPKGAMVGKNDAENIDYDGPCPPPGEKHRYVFKLYALDNVSDLEEGAHSEDIEQAMEGHVLETTELTGIYGH